MKTRMLALVIVIAGGAGQVLSEQQTQESAYDPTRQTEGTKQQLTADLAAAADEHDLLHGRIAGRQGKKATLEGEQAKNLIPDPDLKKQIEAVKGPLKADKVELGSNHGKIIELEGKIADVNKQLGLDESDGLTPKGVESEKPWNDDLVRSQPRPGDRGGQPTDVKQNGASKGHKDCPLRNRPGRSGHRGGGC